MVAEHQLHGHHPAHSLQPCSWSCGWQALAVLHHATAACLQHGVGAPGFTTKSCCSSYKSGLPVTLQLLSAQACRTCATALQRAQVNTMASSCGDCVGWQKELARTCTTWCLARPHARTMRSRIYVHTSLSLSKTVVPWPCSVGFVTLLLLSGGTSSRRPALRPQGAGGVPVPSRFRKGVSALRLCVQSCSRLFMHRHCRIRSGLRGAALRSAAHSFKVPPFLLSLQRGGGDFVWTGASRLGACLVAGVLAAFQRLHVRIGCRGSWLRRVLHVTAGAVVHAHSRHGRQHQLNESVAAPGHDRQKC